MILTGNGANLDVRRIIGALNETDLFIDARKLRSPNRAIGCSPYSADDSFVDVPRVTWL